VIESRRLLQVPARAGKTRVVAVDGRSGAGKTSLAAELRAELGAESRNETGPESRAEFGAESRNEFGAESRNEFGAESRNEFGAESRNEFGAESRNEAGVPVVSLEDLYGGWDGLERGIDLLVSEVLEPLANGWPARVPRYDWVAAAWDTPWVLEPPEVLIVEGVGAGARRAAAYESTLIWVEVAASVRKKRALDRDGETFAPYWDRWAAQENAMLARERTPNRADIVIDGISGSILRA
jgi:uridine kinase